MKNRNFGYLDADNRIVYADDFAEIDGVIYTSPTAEHYARMNPQRLPIVSDPQHNLGAHFVSTEYGDLVDGRIVRRYDERLIVTPPIVYSVEEIIYGLITHNALQAVKELVGDYWELLTMRDTVDAANEIWQAKFPALRDALVSQGILTDAQIDAILKDAEVC